MKKECKRGRINKFGQVTIFVIIAILVVGGVILYFSLKRPINSGVPKDMEQVYKYYLDCLDEKTREGVALLGEQGGYIYTDKLDFVPGSQYMPFSSQLNFYGQAVPYWMYVSGNNLLKEQVPTKKSMELELQRYIKERIDECDFSDFSKQGYDVFIDKKIDNLVTVSINNQNINVEANALMSIFYNNDSVVVSNHKISVDSKLGKFYNLALEVYNFEKQNMFIEKYGLDVMRLYAPVDGVEITCSPKVFVDEQIRQGIVQGLQENVAALKLKGDYYKLANKENKYFVTDIGINVDESVNFIYSPVFPTRVEIYGDRVAEPIGLQEGMGILGFCYVPYHFVYDIDFPVLIQFYDETELFQFPMAIVIDKNQARNALPSTEGVSIESELCKYKNQNVVIYTYDSGLNPLGANIKFKCLNEECAIGSTKVEGKDGVLSALLPQCLNGFIIASAEGYADTKYQISTNQESTANVILNKIYNLSLNLGSVEAALVTFKSSDYSTTAFYPDMKSISLIEGYYNVTVYVYKNSSLKFPAVKSTKCTNVPKSGIGGVLGLEEEKCFDINLPETDVSFAVVGGGKTSEYVTENQLKSAKEMMINVPMFATPTSVSELQDNYAKAEEGTVYISYG